MLFNRLSVRGKLYCLVAFFAASFVGFGLWSHNTLEMAKVKGPYYQQIVQGKDLLADILPPPEYIIESYLYALQLRDLCAEDASKSEMEPLVAHLAKLKSEFETRHDFWVKELPDSPMKRSFLVDAYEPAANFFKLLDTQFVPACLAGNFEVAEELLTGELKNKYEAHRAANDKIVSQVTENVTQSEVTYAEVLGSRGAWAMIGVGLVLAVGCGFSWYSARVIVNPLRTIATVMQAVEKGDLTQRINCRTQDEVGQIGRAVDAAIEAMQAANQKNHESAGQMARVQSMMEQAPINVMFADRDLKIQYMNPASLKTLRTLESILPVKADQMIGQVIDIFHKRPEHQRKLLSDPSNLPHRANIALGKETLDLLVSPVFDQNKAYLGAMVTWEVITAKLAMEQQIKDNAEREKQQAEEMKAKVAQILDVANLVAQGDYSKEITVAGSDAIGQLGEGLAAFFKDKQAAEAKEKVRTDLERKQAEEQRQKVATVLDIVNNVAKGDFALQVPDLGDDAVGQVAKALGQAVSAVRGTMEEVREVAETVSTAAQQLCATSETIASGAQEQASSLEETASSLEEITSTVKQNTDNAQQARQLATSSRDLAEKGGQVVNNAVEAMGAINQASRQIADIITTIDEIAFQTNLLALNAAVEAARAGEQGRGFAVVAAEVRNLAQRSASAAKEIKNLIQDSGRKVDAGTELVNKSGQTLEEIVTSGKRVSDIVTEIAAASKEQLTGIEQVNKAVTQMDQVTQTNAGQTEEMSGSSQSLVANAEQLRELVGRFKLSERQGERHMPSQASASESKSHKSAAKSVPATNRNGNARLRSSSVGLAGKSNGARHELDSLGSKGPAGNGFEEF